MWWLVVATVILLLLVDYCLKDDAFEKIPGPKGVILFGNALHFLMSRVQLFYKLLSLNNTYKNIYKLKMGYKKFAIVIDPEDIETIISGSSNSRKGFIYTFVEQWLKKGLLLNSGPLWQERRKILTPTFHFKILQHFNVIVEENARLMAQRLTQEVDKPKTDIMPFLTDYTLNSICETAMGTKLDPETSNFARRYKKALYDLGDYTVDRIQKVWLYPNFIFDLTKTGREVTKIIDLLTSFSNTIVNKRREANEYEYNIQDVDEGNVYENKGKSKLAMLDLLLKAEKDGTIDAKGISQEVDTFIFGGHDTTARALQFTFMLLANHQDWQEKVAEECANVLGDIDRPVTLSDLNQLKYLDVCIKESLRLYPPAFMIARIIDKDLKLKNYTLPAGTDCMIGIFQVHRRPDQFSEPLSFRPDRFLKDPTWHPYSYIPFSAGPRNCIGFKFAIMEMKLILSAVLRRYKLLPVTRPQDLIFVVDFLLKTSNTIYVKFELRK